MQHAILGTHHLISGGRPRLKLKKIVCRHKSKKKKFAENVGRKKKFVVEIDEKYVDQKKHQKVTYTIGKAYDKIYQMVRPLVTAWVM